MAVALLDEAAETSVHTPQPRGHLFRTCLRVGVRVLGVRQFALEVAQPRGRRVEPRLDLLEREGRLCDRRLSLRETAARVVELVPGVTQPIDGIGHSRDGDGDAERHSSHGCRDTPAEVPRVAHEHVLGLSDPPLDRVATTSDRPVTQRRSVGSVDEVEARPCRRALEGLLGVPATEGNAVDVLRNGLRIYPAMLEAIRSAQSTIDMLTFVYWTGDIAVEIAEALAERAAAGVRVRLLLDAFGARYMDRGLVDMLEDRGVTVRFFRPPDGVDGVHHLPHRTHRKVLICDEEVAFTGGVGIAEEWEGDARGPSEWRDTHFRFRGPVVDGLRAAFVENWAETGPFFDDRDRFPDQPQDGRSTVQVIRGSAQIGWNDITTLKRTLVELAEERIRITTAYFSPDDVLRDLLIAAVERGVTVDVLLPGRYADKRVAQLAGEETFEELIDAGVRIWRYQRTMLHAKITTVDGTVAVVGSSNYNSRSLSHDDEVDCVVFDVEVVETLDRHFGEDLAFAERVDPDRWRDRSLLQRARERAVGLITDWV